MACPSSPSFPAPPAFQAPWSRIPTLIRTLHPRVYQGELENEHECKAREQPDHENVVMKGSRATSEPRICRRNYEPPQRPKHAEEESGRCRRENRNGRHHVRAGAPGAPVEAEGGLVGKGGRSFGKRKSWLRSSHWKKAIEVFSLRALEAFSSRSDQSGNLARTMMN